MQLKWHGTAAVEAICASGRILFDPFVPLRGSGRLCRCMGLRSVFFTAGMPFCRKHRLRWRLKCFVHRIAEIFLFC